MYILKNAITSIRRSKGRNILIGIIIIVIAVSCTITLAIRESANQIVTAYEEKNEIEATIEMNRQTLMDYLRDGNKTQEQMVEAFNKIEYLQSRRVLKLSGGEQQRVAIANGSLSYNPEIILADEPTGNLDKETENEILDIFLRLAHEENKCVIIVTHSENVCDKVDIIYELKKNKK